jgi:hypothetical protein
MFAHALNVLFLSFWGAYSNRPSLPSLFGPISANHPMGHYQLPLNSGWRLVLMMVFWW